MIKKTHIVIYVISAIAVLLISYVLLSPIKHQNTSANVQSSEVADNIETTNSQDSWSNTLIDNSVEIVSSNTYRNADILELDKLCSVSAEELPQANVTCEKNYCKADGFTDEQQRVYDEIISCCKNLEYSRDIDTFLSLDEMQEVTAAALRTYSLYWMDLEGGIEYQYSTGVARYRIIPSYNADAKKMLMQRDELETLIHRIIAYADETGNHTTPEQFALFAGTWLKNHCQYRTEAPDIKHRTAYGAFMENEALCSGYTHAFNWLMIEAGYDYYYFEGYNEEGEPHSWSGYTDSRGDIIQVDVTQTSYMDKSKDASWIDYLQIDEYENRKETMRIHYLRS